MLWGIMICFLPEG